MAYYEIQDLEYWDEKIREKVGEFGLACFPQEFEICDHIQMLGYMAYSGMPSHYPHWSYGKAYEKLKTLYDYGVSGIPYEMVINSSPSIAYLMCDNSLALQVLTMAHVYGHNDFFKNNFTFRHIRSQDVIGSFKASADRVRGYIEDPSIGLEKVEVVLDAAHSLSLQCRKDLAIKKLTAKEQEEWAVDKSLPQKDLFSDLHKRKEYVEPDLHKIPLEPEADILLFIRDYNPLLSGWVKDILTIVHDQAQYFIPQIETKIMNEGWASYWHREILNSLNLPQDLHLEFLVRHNQVVSPHPRGLNPYNVGLKVWDYIKRRYDEPTGEEIEKYGKPDMGGKEKIFEVREVERDISFLRRFLTEELMREMEMFEYQFKGEEIVVSRVSDRDEWKTIKETFLKNVGMGTIPSIKVELIDPKTRFLCLKHYYEGDERDLQVEWAEKTMQHIKALWGNGVSLETSFKGKKHILSVSAEGNFATKPAS